MTSSAAACRGKADVWAPDWASQTRKPLGKALGSVLGGVLGRFSPRTRTAPTKSTTTDQHDVTDGGVMEWAGTTPVLGGLGRPIPTPVGSLLPPSGGRSRPRFA
jgi:hypothetical protein